MNSKLLWKFLLVVFVVAYAVNEAWPPQGRPLLEVLEQRAENKDATFEQIVATAGAMNATNSARAFGNLWDAVGTNQLAGYFPSIVTTGEKDPNRAILQRLQKDASGKIKLGLDLQGGTMFVVGVDTSGGEGADRAAAERDDLLFQAIEVLRKRVDKFGVAEPIIQPQGDDRIIIQLPGLSQGDLDSARRQIEQAAVLHFRIVHPQSAQLVAEDIPEPGYEFMTETDKDENGNPVLRRYLVSRKPERGLTGRYIERAMATRDAVTGKPEIAFTFNNEGAVIFGEVTEANIGNQLAIVLDGELYSAPVINSKITKNGVISGNFTLKQAIELANVLENPLETPVKILEERTVDPSLGADSIKSGVRATLIGLIAVVLFMFVYYLLAGIVANAALALNIVILLGVFCSIDATLTLPGIAGILLTIGMAVDANVLIFERIREELRAGKSTKGSLSAGYDRAFGTIFDSNVTSLIASVILIKMGTGPVQGFGVTLTIGVAVSLFTALFVTRLFFDFMQEQGWLKSLKMLNLLGDTKIDFLKLAKPAFALSWVLVISGMIFAFNRGEEAVGVDFKGGAALTIDFKQEPPIDNLRTTLNGLNRGEAQIQYQTELATGAKHLQVVIGLGTDVEEKQAPVDKLVEQALVQGFPEAGFVVKSVEKIGPTVGQEILSTAIWATVLALFGILVYVAFRYEFSFAVGAVVAVIHDVLMTMGWFCLSGRELSAPMVAAVLTIIGFSINDTIVIFDRIREDLKLGVRGSFREIINQALNKTLSRTVITSGTTFLATLSLYLFGGGVINDFAFTFLVGIVVGTYSTIYIASAFVLWWHKGKRPDLGAGPGGAGRGVVRKPAPEPA